MGKKWLLWTDLETTGLDIYKNRIIQIACVLSDYKVSVKLTLPEITLHCSRKEWDEMGEWCTKQHAPLQERVLGSTITTHQAEEMVLSFLDGLVDPRNDVVYIAGNSVHFDKAFIDKHLPRVSSRLSHRIVDVSSLALVCENLAPETYARRPIKTKTHTAASDISESIEEYVYYKELLFRSVTN
jgi:oligoribonuclease